MGHYDDCYAADEERYRLRAEEKRNDVRNAIDKMLDRGMLVEILTDIAIKTNSDSTLLNRYYFMDRKDDG